MTNKMSLLRHWGRMVLHNPLLSLLGSCWTAIKYGAAKTSHQTISENQPSKHVIRFPLRGLVLEYMGRHWGSKRPGRGQSNASELTIARSDQLRGCCKKRYHQREEMRFWDIHTSYLALLACCNFRLSRTWGNVERPLDPLLKGPMCAFFALSKGQFVGFNGCWKDSWCLNAKIWSTVAGCTCPSPQWWLHKVTIGFWDHVSLQSARGSGSCGFSPGGGRRYS